MPPSVRLPETTESIVTSGQELRSGRISSVELTRTALDRIEAHNTTLNAVVTVTAELALEAARRADRDLRAGRDRGPLHGIPVGLKDVIDVRGVRTTMGSAFCQDYVAARDATVVRRLREWMRVPIVVVSARDREQGKQEREQQKTPAHDGSFQVSVVLTHFNSPSGAAGLAD